MVEDGCKLTKIKVFDTTALVSDGRDPAEKCEKNGLRRGTGRSNAWIQTRVGKV
jgi:hypothetical protein